MTQYVDGFVVPVPRDNLEEYRKLAEEAGRVWKEHGALEYIECVADDVEPGEVTSFPQSVQLRPDETVIFAWIVYASKEERDAINDKVMQDPRIAGIDFNDLPFDGKRMFWGGFRMLVKG